MANEQQEVNGGGGAARGPRSPNFPAITLQDALAKARILYDKDKRATVSSKTVLAHLGFGEKISGSSARVLSALKQFGLLDETTGVFRVTDAAFRLFSLSESAPERLKALQDCARKPAIYRDLLDKYEDGLPSDAALSDYLILNKKFNPVSVQSFIRVFKATLEFAKLTPGAYTEPKDPPTGPAVGDYVQWESQGVLQFEARKVTAKSADGEYVFVEGTSTGIPASQVQRVDPPSHGISGAHIPSTAQVFQPSGSGGAVATMAHEVSDLKDGKAMLQWPATLSADSIDELDDWLQLLIKKLRKRAGISPTKDAD
jgi:hypothetical protein